MKNAVTVNGLIPADQIGRTLPHEHLFATMTYAYPAADEEAYRPITIDRLGEIRADLMTNANNIHLDSSCGQGLELRKAAEAGIDTLVELTHRSDRAQPRTDGGGVPLHRRERDLGNRLVSAPPPAAPGR